MRKNMYNQEASDYKILVLDDEQGILDSLDVFLSPYGYTITRND